MPDELSKAVANLKKGDKTEILNTCYHSGTDELFLTLKAGDNELLVKVLGVE